MSLVLDAALAFHRAGICVIPAADNGTKQPWPDGPQWTRYMSDRPTETQLQAWFAGRYTGMGLVCGAVSSGLEMLEFEGRAIAEGFFTEAGQAAEAAGLGGTWRRLTTGYMELTPSRGIHLLMRIDGAVVPGNTKLAERPASEAEITSQERADIDDRAARGIEYWPRRTLMETRGEGGFTVTAPSHGPVHPTGEPWRPVNGSAATIPVITAAEREQLHRVLRSLDQMPAPAAPLQQPGRAPREDDGTLKPGDDYARRTDWRDILPSGWTITATLRNGARNWRRPGKGEGMSATTGRPPYDNLYVFSTSTEFDDLVPISKFRAYAVLRHGGDEHAAARALRAAGYGGPPPGGLGQPPAFQQPVPAASLNGHAATAEPGPGSSLVIEGGLPDYDLGALAALGIKEPERIAGGMLYPGSVHCIAGPPGGGKTTIVAWWMLRHIRDGGAVMLLDEESGPEQAAEKFLDLGATPAELSPPRFTYVPFPSRGWNTADLLQLHQRVTERRPGIIAWDSAAAFLAIAGQDENSAADVTAFWQRVLVPCARQHGAAVVAVDHIVKSGEASGYGRGSGAKKAASDVQYMMEVIKPFSRAQNGILRLTTAPGKDRRGWLAQAYEINVRTGSPVTLEITEAIPGAFEDTAEMKPAKAKLWEALNAIATEAHPATSDQLVNWISKKYGHGLRRPTCSKYLNELAADGLAGGALMGSAKSKFWHPIQVSASGDASSMTRLSASSPLTGDDDDDDTCQTADADTRSHP